ncbi:MAG TPA: 50S ribosomal protein L19 [Candidatus Moranbacteria bacterium]|nr:50S ribosomal protein L19 [Candidatus Moranbacteria bacterium]
MNQKVIQFNKSQQNKEIPNVQVGDIVRVHRKIKEGEKERVQVFKGLVIAIKGRQSSSPTITVRRESDGVGIEMILPIYLPTIKKIDVLRHSKVRRSKLYYMRNRTGRNAKMKVKDLTETEIDAQKKVEKRPKKEAAAKDEKLEASKTEKKASEDKK